MHNSPVFTFPSAFKVIPQSMRRYLFGSMLSLFIAVSVAEASGIEGIVVAKDANASRITLQTAEGDEHIFLVGRGDRAILEVGDHITGERVRQGQNWRLEQIFPARPEELAIIDRLADQLRRETLRRGRGVFRSVGERVPRFALWNQHGDLFLGESLRGNYYVMNFVFTRCGVQEMCPASTRKMVELSQMVEERDWDDVKLVSITLDPAYDTPGIWYAYGEDNGIDQDRHLLLGGPAQVVTDLRAQMGILAEPDERQIVNHTMSTALVDPTGLIIYRIPGSRWEPAVFVRQIERHRAGN